MSSVVGSTYNISEMSTVVLKNRSKTFTIDLKCLNSDTMVTIFLKYA